MSEANEGSDRAALVEYLPESQQTRIVQVIQRLQVTPIPEKESVVIVIAYYQDNPEELVPFQDFVWMMNREKTQDLIQQLQAALQQLE